MLNSSFVWILSRVAGWEATSTSKVRLYGLSSDVLWGAAIGTSLTGFVLSGSGLFPNGYLVGRLFSGDYFSNSWRSKSGVCFNRSGPLLFIFSGSVLFCSFFCGGTDYSATDLVVRVVGFFVRATPYRRFFVKAKFHGPVFYRGRGFLYVLSHYRAINSRGYHAILYRFLR